MGTVLGFVIVIIALALVYDFLNGANDSANAIATVIATKALTPLKALALASFFNVLGALAFTAVAKTIGKGIFRQRLYRLRLSSWCSSVA